MKKETIKNLGTIDLENVSIGEGQIEVSVPVDGIAEQLDKILDECTSDYMKKYSSVKSCQELYYDVRVVFSFGGFALGNKDEAEFTLLVIVWQSANDDGAEYFTDIPVSFNEADSRKIKRMIWDALGKNLFNL